MIFQRIHWVSFVCSLWVFLTPYIGRDRNWFKSHPKKYGMGWWTVTFARSIVPCRIQSATSDMLSLQRRKQRLGSPTPMERDRIQPKRRYPLPAKRRYHPSVTRGNDSEFTFSQCTCSHNKAEQ